MRFPPLFAPEQESTPDVNKTIDVAAVTILLLEMAFDAPPTFVLVPLVGFWLMYIHDELNQGLFNHHFLLVTGLCCLHAIVMTFACLVLAVSSFSGDSVNRWSIDCCSPCRLHLFFILTGNQV
jgi:hypothetical protein